MFSLKLVIVFINFFLNVHSLEFVKEEFQKPNLQVHTASGIVQGTRLPSKNVKNGYYFAFLGIPYAEAPVGELRFRPPKLIRNWFGVLDGTRERSACVEINLRQGIRNTEIIGKEDCLFLNIFTKTNPINIKRPKAVMVFIYGGAYLFGSSYISRHGPDLLVSKDVLVVTFNYRLGPFGFLSTEDLVSPGNYGLKDQNMVLRWIQKNIKYFGGDPNNVTIFGHSAGSASVNFHMLSPKSRGLFHKALLESGGALCFWSSQRKARSVAYLFGAANGITNPSDTQDLLEKLRAVPIEDIKQSLIGVTFTAFLQFLFTGIPFAPTFEEDHPGAFLTRNNWYEMLREGNFNRVPVVMGMTRNESLFFVKDLSEAQFLLSTVVDLDNGILASKSLNISDSDALSYAGRLIMNRYFGMNSRLADTDLLTLTWLGNEDMFKRPLWKTAELMSKHVPLYFYNFGYESDLGRNALGKGREYPGVRGVAHEEELYFIFNKFNNNPTKKTDYIVRDRLLTLWTNFAKFGNPTPHMKIGSDVLGEFVWPTFNSSRTTFLDISDTLNLRDTLDDHSNIIWWNDLFKKYGYPPFHTY